MTLYDLFRSLSKFFARSVPLSLSRPLSVSLCPSLNLFLSHAPSLSRPLSVSLSLSLSRPLYVSLSLSINLFMSHSLSQSTSFCLTLSLSQPLSVSLSLSLSTFLSHSRPLSVSLVLVFHFVLLSLMCSLCPFCYCTSIFIVFFPTLFSLAILFSFLCGSCCSTVLASLSHTLSLFFLLFPFSHSFSLSLSLSLLPLLFWVHLPQSLSLHSCHMTFRAVCGHHVVFVQFL